MGPAWQQPSIEGAERSGTRSRVRSGSTTAQRPTSADVSMPLRGCNVTPASRHCTLPRGCATSQVVFARHGDLVTRNVLPLSVGRVKRFGPAVPYATQPLKDLL